MNNYQMDKIGQTDIKIYNLEKYYELERQLTKTSPFVKTTPKINTISLLSHVLAWGMEMDGVRSCLGSLVTSSPDRVRT